MLTNIFLSGDMLPIVVACLGTQELYSYRYQH